MGPGVTHVNSFVRYSSTIKSIPRCDVSPEQPSPIQARQLRRSASPTFESLACLCRDNRQKCTCHVTRGDPRHSSVWTCMSIKQQDRLDPNRQKVNVPGTCHLGTKYAHSRRHLVGDVARGFGALSVATMSNRTSSGATHLTPSVALSKILQIGTSANLPANKPTSSAIAAISGNTLRPRAHQGLDPASTPSSPKRQLFRKPYVLSEILVSRAY
jgi:hypothetical protein